MNEYLVYLDHNSVIDVMNSRDHALAHAVDVAKSLGARFVYSPAHIEEIANILREKSLSDEQCDEFTHRNLTFIANLTANWEFLPGGSGPTILKQEHPAVCYRRVIDKYEWTYDSEETEEFLRSLVKADRATSTPLEAFKIPKVRAIFDQRLWAAGYSEHLPQGPELRQCHDVAARLVDMCFRSLADAGYGLESKKKFRSAIHDVTHSIYALAADIFVSGDQRMLGKAKATYKFLEAECRVMSPEELVVFVANPNSN